jgi:hypothetical protein
MTLNHSIHPCPAGIPEPTNCFFGKCDTCLYPDFEEKVQQDAREWQEMKKTVLEEMNQNYGRGR